MKQVKKKSSEPKAKTKLRPNIVFGRMNYILLVIGIVVIIAGFIALSKGSITLAPILLVIGYCVILPLAILIKSSPSPATKKDETPPKPQTAPPKSGE
jgi:membrane-bound ClpP family serine protease